MSIKLRDKMVKWLLLVIFITAAVAADFDKAVS